MELASFRVEERVESVSVLDANPCYNVPNIRQDDDDGDPASKNPQVKSGPTVKVGFSAPTSHVCFIFGFILVGVLVCGSLAFSAWNFTEVRMFHDDLFNTMVEPVIGCCPDHLSTSCFHILLANPSSPSGHYWIRSSNGSAVRVYCEMTRLCGSITGGWVRVGNLDRSNNSIPCPSGFKERNDSGLLTCGIDSGSTNAACASIDFSTDNIAYNKICGKILAYQSRSTEAFSRSETDLTIDSNYVDGVSLTHGRNPREHIWTLASAASEEVIDLGGSCKCLDPSREDIRMPPDFIGQDYFCDTGTRRPQNSLPIYRDNPLWDGAGCGLNSTCCSFNDPPWFHKQLPSATTDDIEMRVCRDESRDNEDIAISRVEIYVQ